MPSATASQTLTWRGVPRPVRVLVLARTVNRLGAFSMAFLGLLLTRHLGASLTTAGVVLAAFGLATVPSRLAGGRLADRIGRRRTIVLGLVGCAVSQLWIAASPTVASAAVAAVAFGLAYEIYEPASQAIIADVSAPEDRPAAYALLQASMAVAGVLAGGIAAAVSSLDLRLLFVIDAASCLACAAIVRAYLPAGEVTAPAYDAVPVRPWRDTRLLLLLGVGSVLATIYMLLVMALPLTLDARGLPSWHLGVLLAASAVTGVAVTPFVPVLTAGRDSFATMRAAYVVLAVGLVAYAYADRLSLFLVGTVVCGAAEVLLLGHGMALAAGLAPEHGRAAYLAVFGLSWGVATTLAPLLGTQLLDRGGPVAAWLLPAAAALACAWAQPALRRRLTPSHDACEG
ncbi:MFS transporter [Luteipulveratus halotolerans]|uniref:Arabinose transporter permease n=1 Tax=Luteipulveratus halotolerans TaxID=1631356 RepID=A0A0L6CMG2_9MICO|nr:MFS transporter [Luteipulveratus halotolerans]KNX38956.1 arabinose transporter permease [Luteipulveratus halotolerans]